MLPYRTILKSLLLPLILLGSFACTRATLEEEVVLPPAPEGYVRTSLNLVVTDNERVTTRATEAEEKAYDDNNIWVLLFNANPTTNAPTTLLQAPVKVTKSGSQFYALLRATTQPVAMYVVTGLTTTMNSYLATASNFTVGTTTYTQLSTASQLQTAAITATGIPIGSGNYFPMYTERLSYPAGTASITAIAANFKRAVAKIEVDASTLATSDFALEGVTLINGAQKGYVLPQTPLPTNFGGVVRYNEATTVSGNKIASQLYLYENNGSPTNFTYVVVKGKYKGGASTYYRMALHSRNASGVYIPYSIERNKHYTIAIAKVQTAGYATFNEALANAVSNAEYTVTVSDSDSYDLASGGNYYLGLSNSEYVVYGDDAYTSLPAVTVTHNAPATVTTATMTLSGTGLTFGTVVGATGSATSLTLPTPDGTAQTIAVPINMAPTFTTALTGTLTIRLGNLTKTVTIRRRAGLSAADSELTDFAGSNYMSGEVTAGSSWVMLSPTANATLFPTTATVVSPTGGLYVRYNTLLDMGSVRSRAELSLFRRDESGRVKAAIYPKNVTYLSTTCPDNVDKNGIGLTGGSVFTATFSNPGNFPFKVGLFHGSTLLGESAVSTSTVKSVDFKWAETTNLAQLPRTLTLKYNVNGIWFDIEHTIQQRAVLAVRILSVGGSAININNGTTVNYGTQLGSAVPGNSYTGGLGYLLHKQTGLGKPINFPFQLYNLSAGGNNVAASGPALYNNLTNLLINNNIDILFCTINQSSGGGSVGPNAAQVQEMLTWLGGNPHRGLIFIADYPDNAEITKAIFGVEQTSRGGQDPYKSLPATDPYYTNPVYRSIMNGSYSTINNPALLPGSGDNPKDLRTIPFKNITTGQSYGGVPLARVTAAGFIPVFYVDFSGVDYVLFAVHPVKNIVMMGDINWFANANGPFLDSSGSLAAVSAGQYPKLIMNMWEWYINKVALGKAY